MAVYNTVAGLIQFDPAIRAAGDQTVRDFVIQSIGSGGSTVKVTLWPEFDSTKIAKGDFIVAQGKFETRDVNGTTYYNLSANVLVVNGKPAKREETERSTASSKVEVADDQEMLF